MCCVSSTRAETCPSFSAGRDYNYNCADVFFCPDDHAWSFLTDIAQPACYKRRMSDKPRKPGLEESEAQYKPEEEYVPNDAFDAYLWRNRHCDQCELR